MQTNDSNGDHQHEPCERRVNNPPSCPGSTWTLRLRREAVGGPGRDPGPPVAVRQPEANEGQDPTSSSQPNTGRHAPARRRPRRTPPGQKEGPPGLGA